MQSRFKTWGDARIFLAVARDGSTLQASKTLGMTQTTVARRVEALEHALDLTLFERDTRGFRLTPDGEALRAPAEAIEAAATAFAQTALSRNSAKSGPIRLSAPAAALGETTQGLFRGFAQLRPDVRFQLLPSEHQVDLEAGEADIAVRFAPKVEGDRLIVRKIRDIPLALYASADYVARHGCPESPADLVNHDILNFVDGYGPRAVTDWLNRHVDPARIVQSFAEFSTLFAAIRQSSGIGPMTIEEGQKYDDLIQCLPPQPGTASACWLVVAPSAWERTEVKEFARYIVPAWRKAWAEKTA